MPILHRQLPRLPQHRLRKAYIIPMHLVTRKRKHLGRDPQELYSVLFVELYELHQIPGVGEAERITSLGQGAAIKIMDSSVICNAKLVDVLRDLAVSREIPHQMEILPAGGTDAGAIQSARGGIPAGVISTPTRYVHSSVEMCNKDDIQAVIALMSAFIEEGHQHDYFPQ